MNTVMTLGIGHSLEPASLIPHLEYSIFRIPPYSPVFSRSSRIVVFTHLQIRFRFEDWIETGLDRLMGDSVHICIFYQVCIYEQLSPKINIDNFRPFVKIRKRHRLIIHLL